MSLKPAHHEKWSIGKKTTSIASGCIENTLFNGLLFGFNSIQYVYQYTCYALPKTMTGLPEKSNNNNNTANSSHSLISSLISTKNEPECDKLQTGIVYKLQRNECYSSLSDFNDPNKLQNMTEIFNNQLSFTIQENNVGPVPTNFTISYANAINSNGDKLELYNNLTQCVRGYQQAELGNIMKRAAQCFIMVAFLLGLLWDKIGTRAYRTLVHVLYLLGSISLSTADCKDASRDYLFYGYILIHCAGMATFSTNLRIPGIFPAKQGLVIQLINGAFEASACTLLIAKVVFFEWQGLGATTFWTVWACVAPVIFFVRTFFFMPKMWVRNKREVNEKIGEQVSAIEAENPENVKMVEASASKGKKQTKTSSASPSFFGTIFSSQYACHLWWYFIMDSWNITFFINYLPWAEWLTSNDLQRTSFWVNMWAFSQFAGAPLAMLVGLFYDMKKKSYERKTGDPTIALLRACSATIIITTTVGVMATFLSSYKIENLQWLTFILQLTFRACLYGNHAQALQLLYPQELFGKLYGFSVIPTFIGAEAAGHIVKMATGYGIEFSLIYKVFTGLLATAYVFPIYLHLKSKTL